MPKTREEHVNYTRNELTNYPYYVKIIDVLKLEEIVSYLDIGANVGEVCNLLFEKLPTLKKAYLIEPQMDNFIFMRNNVKNSNVLFYNTAIGYGFTNPILVTDSQQNVGGYRIVENDDNIVGETIKLSKIEDLNIPVVDLVKIDIEGGEFNLIENSTYLQKIKWIEIEFHIDKSVDKKQETIVYLRKYFPNHSILIIEDTLFARVLLKLGKDE